MKRLVELDKVCKLFPTGFVRESLIKTLNSVLLGKKEAQRFSALTDVTFSLDRGEVLGLVGRNGAGKSTLLKVISGIFCHDSGLLTVCGGVAPIFSWGVGFIDELSAYDNIFLYGSLLGMSTRATRDSLDLILDFAELKESRNKRLRTYSSGMRARLAFATAIQAPFEILILDEVFSVGDLGFQRKCIDALGQITRQGRSIIHASHDLDMLRAHSNRCLLLEKGMVRSLGPCDGVLREYYELLSGLHN